MTETKRCPECGRPVAFLYSEATCSVRGSYPCELTRLRAELATLREQDEHLAWERGYEQGYSDREKTDHDRADVLKEPNPYPQKSSQ